MAFGDPLGAERDVGVGTAPLEQVEDVLGRPRIDRAPQDDQHACAKMGSQLIHGPLEHRHGRVQELIDGRSDHDDDVGGPAQDRRVSAQLEAAGRQELAQEPFRAVLEKGHLPAPDALQRRIRDVEDPDPQASTGEREAEGEPHVTGSADDDKIDVRVAQVSSRGWHRSGSRGAEAAELTAHRLDRRDQAEGPRHVRSDIGDRDRKALPAGDVD